VAKRLPAFLLLSAISCFFRPESAPCRRLVQHLLEPHPRPLAGQPDELLLPDPERREDVGQHYKGGDQEAALKAAGCDIIRFEKASGGSREGRSELASIIEFIRPGDVLVVSKLDRLGRNTRDVLNLVHELDEKGACLRVVEPAIDTCGPMGRMVITVLGMVAEMDSFSAGQASAGFSPSSEPAPAIRRPT
jgi:Resolvase, N terminal domain